MKISSASVGEEKGVGQLKNSPDFLAMMDKLKAARLKLGK